MKALAKVGYNGPISPEIRRKPNLRKINVAVDIKPIQGLFHAMRYRVSPTEPTRHISRTEHFRKRLHGFAAFLECAFSGIVEADGVSIRSV
jgi:hypothetical protein